MFYFCVFYDLKYFLTKSYYSEIRQVHSDIDLDLKLLNTFICR